MLKTNALEIELTTKCTLGCPACPRNDPGDNKEDWDVGHLDTDLAKKLILDPSYGNLLFVGCYGDPIYHPKFIEIMHYAISNKRHVTVHTNGSYKKQKWWDQLADNDNWNKGHQFTFSVDGLEDTNGIHRIRQQSSSIIAGMETMSKTNATVIWKMLVFPFNVHQVPEARAMCNDMGIKFEPVTSERNVTSYVHPTPEIFVMPKGHKYDNA